MIWNKAFGVFALLFTVNSVIDSFKRPSIPYNHYLNGVFRPVEKERTVEVEHEHYLLSKLSGTFSQIGSNPRNLGTKDAGYHWFDGDGMVHAALFNGTSFTYVNRWVETKRYKAELRWGKKMYLYFGELRGIHGMVEIMKWSMLQMLALVPGARGTANTAFLEWDGQHYALHEGDFPYSIYFDRKTNNIITKAQLEIPNVKSVTAHPKIDKKRDELYLYGYNNYDFVNGVFFHNVLNKNLEIIHQSNIPLINNGMIHDVAQTRNHLIIPDLPLKYDFNKIMENKLPLAFDNNGTSRFGTMHKDTKAVEWYYLEDDNVFIFHFTEHAFELHNSFVIYACVMDFLDMEDFVHLDNPEHKIRGNLRLQQIVLNKKTKKATIIKNDFIEKIPNFDDIEYNMDFPMTSKLNPKHIYCSIFNAKTGKIIGFTKTDISQFTEKSKSTCIFRLDSMYVNSEAQVVVIDGIEYLLCFTYDDDEQNSYVSLIQVSHTQIHSVRIPSVRIPPGFHSMYHE